MRAINIILTLMLLSQIICAQKYDFRGKLFSDLAGISDDQPNGLIQLNTYLSFTRLTKKELELIGKSDDSDSLQVDFTNPTEKNQSSFGAYFLRNVVFDFTFSKIEQEDYFLKARNTDSFQTDGLQLFNRTDLFQYANLVSIIKLNTLTLKFWNQFYLYVDFVGSYYRTGISYEDQNSDLTTRNVGSTALGFNVKMNTNVAQNSPFRFDFGFSKLYPTFYNTRFKEIGGFQTIDASSFVSQEELVSKTTPLDIIDFVVTNEGKADSKNATQTHLRIGLIGNYLSKDVEFKNSFLVFQLGVDVSISSLLTKKDE